LIKIKMRIALVDVDDCLVCNATGAINHELIARLSGDGSDEKGETFDAVWLFSGRNALDMWRHIMRFGQQTHRAVWMPQLLTRVRDELEAGGVRVAGISLPYDKVFGWAPGDGYAKSGLAALEQTFIDDANADDSADDSTDNADAAAVTSPAFRMNQILVRIKTTMADVDDGMMLQLAMSGDMNKCGQLGHFVKSLIANAKVTLVYFDDRTDNLNACADYASKLGIDLELETVHVTFTH
jgi:hypothetical protein